MKGKTPTKSEKQRFDIICQIGCVVCKREYGLYSPCSIHHIDGRTKPGSHLKTIGLCGHHHQTGGYGVALHAGKKEFEYHHGTEAELLEYQNKLIAEYD